MTSEDKIRFYGSKYCGHSRVAQNYLSRNDIEFEYYDVNNDPEAEAYVKELNNGNRSVPTLVFPDGTVMTEPSNAEIGKKLGI